MIRTIMSEEYTFVKELIRKDIFQNVYMYIDINLYGYETDKIKTWVLESDKHIKAVIYMYYSSIQFFQSMDLNCDDIAELSRFICDLKPEMVSGKVEPIEKIFRELNGEYEISNGVIMTKDKESEVYKFDICEKAGLDDCGEIAGLICSDDSIGGHYTVAILEEQLRDRMENSGCRSFVVREDDKIVSHAATYAEISELAVIGGVVTDVNYRRKGFAEKVISTLSNELIFEKKIPILYCYYDRTIQWYKSRGWKITTACAKLELKKH